jgi:hypothetical protein
LGSTGSSNESWPPSKDGDDAEMYSPNNIINVDEDITATNGKNNFTVEDDQEEELEQV